MLRRWRAGEAAIDGFLDDYAFLALGLLDLYETSFDRADLDFAATLAERMIELFGDPAGGFFSTAEGDASLVMRLKEDYDGAEPSGNSVAALALLKLAAITERADLREKALKPIRTFGARLQSSPQAAPYLLQALAFSLAEPRRVVIAGDARDPLARKLLRAAHGVFQPHKVILGTTGQTLTVRHDTFDRASFMPGVVLACKKVVATPGLTLGLDAIL